MIEFCVDCDRFTYLVNDLLLFQWIKRNSYFMDDSLNISIQLKAYTQHIPLLLFSKHIYHTIYGGISLIGKFHSE